MVDYVVMRASPDWLKFNIEDAKHFLVAGGYDPYLLERFVQIWDVNFYVDFRTFRYRLKMITEKTALSTGATIIKKSELSKIKDDDRVVFLDDDDWLAPNLFDALSKNLEFDGQRWPSVRIGFNYDPTSPNAKIIHKRPQSQIVYTNNYMVTGRSLWKYGRQAIVEHSHANHTFGLETFKVIDHLSYLSCAVKHPCCTTAMIVLLDDISFKTQPFTTLNAFVNGLYSCFIPNDIEWLKHPLADLKKLLAETIGKY